MPQNAIKQCHFDTRSERCTPIILLNPINYWDMKLSISAGRPDLNVSISLRSPFLCYFDRTIQLICNVSIKNLGVAENYASWAH